MKKYNKDFWVNLGFSFLIGIIVACVEIIFPIFNGKVALVFLRDGIIGMVIGSIARYGCGVMISRNQFSNKLMFLYVFCIIGIVSIIPAIIFNTILNEPILSMQLLAMVLVAEALGLGLTYLSIKYYSRLNDGLILKKKEMLENR